MPVDSSKTIQSWNSQRDGDLMPLNPPVWPRSKTNSCWRITLILKNSLRSQQISISWGLSTRWLKWTMRQPTTMKLNNWPKSWLPSRGILKPQHPNISSKASQPISASKITYSSTEIRIWLIRLIWWRSRMRTMATMKSLIQISPRHSLKALWTHFCPSASQSSQRARSGWFTEPWLNWAQPRYREMGVPKKGSTEAAARTMRGWARFYGTKC